MIDTRKRFILTLAAAAMLMAAGCSSKPEPPKETPAPAVTPPPAETPKETPPPAPETKKAPEPEKKAETKKPEAKKAAPLGNTAPAEFQVKMTTTAGTITLAVHKAWAPIGAQRFYELVKSGYYDNTGFFRVVPNFVVQFGLAADPAITKKWDKKIQDDPVTHTNKTGSLVFATAGPNTRTTQLFINLKSNQFLDSQGFAPFAEVTDGMDVVTKIYAGYGEQPNQHDIETQGDAYVKSKFPEMTMIKTAKIVQ